MRTHGNAVGVLLLYPGSLRLAFLCGEAAGAGRAGLAGGGTIKNPRPPHTAHTIPIGCSSLKDFCLDILPAALVQVGGSDPQRRGSVR